MKNKFRLSLYQKGVLEDKNITEERFIEQWKMELEFTRSDRCLNNMLYYIAEDFFFNEDADGCTNLVDFMEDAKRPYGNKNIELSICHVLNIGTDKLRQVGILPEFVKQECRRWHGNAINIAKCKLEKSKKLEEAIVLTKRCI